MDPIESVPLTQYSHGGGCGCKISPAYLDRILDFGLIPPDAPVKKPVGDHPSRDDAALYDLGTGQGLLCTTDFFMPIVDDPFDFGRIAAANALSDIYAMGGRPLSAIAILGWPVNVLSTDVAQQVLKGASETCREAGIAIGGGHSIDNPEPIFGLAVNGLVALECVKHNHTGKPGDLLFLTKPLGLGIFSTAGKKGILSDDDYERALALMLALNTLGEQLGPLKCVHALTDVTGFGLLGHVCEMCSGNTLSARIHFDAVPRLPNLEYYIQQGCTTGGGTRNWKSYRYKIKAPSAFAEIVLSDPQTNGGLLIAVDPAEAARFETLMRESHQHDALHRIGHLETRTDDGLVVID